MASTGIGPHPTHQTIHITVNDKYVTMQMPPAGTLKVGDTVSYVSSAGTVSVVFKDQSPCDTQVIDTGESPTLNTPGQFTCRCFVFRPNGDIVGWTPEGEYGGGVHDVTR